MREVFLLPDESTEAALVLTGDPTDGKSERLELALTEELRRHLTAIIRTPDSTGQRQHSAEEPASSTHASRTSTAPDPDLSVPLTLRPRDIQERIRGGATIQDLAAEMGVPESRVEPYAHPVLQERARVAELAKESHPVREDGPARLNLWEVLETAFAARGADLHGSQWDAYRAPGGTWVVTVAWRSGSALHTAEWTIQDHLSSHATAVARNKEATQLLDPNYAPPVRRLSAVRDGREPEAELGSDLPVGVALTGHTPPEPDRANGTGIQPRREDDSTSHLSSLTSDDDEDESAEGFLQHPDDEQDPGTKPHNRRRKAVTPAWEDVLMSVRTNTKRPRK